MILRVVFSAKARKEMAQALAYTYKKFGDRKYKDYDALINEAVVVLTQTPMAGQHRQDIHRDAYTYHIGRSGRKARHLFLYRIKEDVEVARFLYDGMDLQMHWPGDW